MEHLNISEKRMVANFGNDITERIKNNDNALICNFILNGKKYYVGYNADRKVFYSPSRFPDEPLT